MKLLEIKIDTELTPCLPDAVISLAKELRTVGTEEEMVSFFGKLSDVSDIMQILGTVLASFMILRQDIKEGIIELSKRLFLTGEISIWDLIGLSFLCAACKTEEEEGTGVNPSIGVIH